MEAEYVRDEVNSKISMGEVSLLCDEKILDKKVMNRIITSTILQLHLKQYIQFNKDEKGKVIIQIQNAKETLKKTEKLIFKCLKESDIEKDSQLKLEEITRNNNRIFYNHKKQLKDLIIEETIEDEYIDKQKLELKEKYFNTMMIMILLMILFFIVRIGVGDLYGSLLVLCLFTIIGIYLDKKFKNIDIYTPKAKEEKERLKGLKKYLQDYSLIDKREILEIYLWEKYLAYATIFNINHNIIEILQVNLEEKTKDKKEIQFDFYENKYFYIDDKNQKIYISPKEQENLFQAEYNLKRKDGEQK